MVVECRRYPIGVMGIVTVELLTAAKVCITQLLHVGEVERGEDVCCWLDLVPGAVVSVHEDHDIWKLVVVIDDESQICHGFTTFVRRREVGCCRVVCDILVYLPTMKQVVSRLSCL